MKRRSFIKMAGTAGATLMSAKLGALAAEPLEFINPIDGDMLNAQNDGHIENGKLVITVTLKAREGSKIKLNGIDCRLVDGNHVADVPLAGYRNELVAVDLASGEKAKAIVFWLRNFTGHYRLSLDDNIWFFKDLSVNASRYKSIFENPYLAFLKQVHDQYGTKIHINIFYQTDGFNLSQLTDKYKKEWQMNAGWLKLSFHALAEKPDRPYHDAGYDQVKTDCEKVVKEIKRFAGPELLGSVTTLHWGEARVEGSRALRDAGYTTQVGYFNVDDDQYPVSYYLTEEQRRHIKQRSIWHDTREGITFVRISQVINLYKLEQVVPLLNEVKSNPRRAEFIELMIHEQYFHQNYEAYQPDFREKVLTAVKWAVDNGYKPAFLEECVS